MCRSGFNYVAQRASIGMYQLPAILNTYTLFRRIIHARDDAC